MHINLQIIFTFIQYFEVNQKVEAKRFPPLLDVWYTGPSISCSAFAGKPGVRRGRFKCQVWFSVGGVVSLHFSVTPAITWLRLIGLPSVWGRLSSVSVQDANILLLTIIDSVWDGSEVHV